MSSRILIFANPIAGRGKGRIIGQRLQDRLTREGWTVHAIFDRADRVDPALLNDPADAAIVIGGDGTLRAVARQLCINSNCCPPILIVPMGTANLMGRHLGIRWRDDTLEDDITRAIRQHRIVSLDAATANGELFLLMAGIGIDGHIVHELDRIRSGPIRFSSYIKPALTALANYEFKSLRVILDDQEVFPLAPAMAFVGNVKEYGTGFPILPHARPDDDALDVCVLPCASKADLIHLFASAVLGEHVNASGVVYRKGRSVRIEGPSPVPVQLDGEAAGFTPLDVTLLPHRIGFIVPAT